LEGDEKMKIRKGKISDARKIFNFLGSAPELHASKSNQDYDAGNHEWLKFCT